MVLPGITKKRILLLLATGAALGFSRSPRGYFKILKAFVHDWREINKEILWKRVREFYEERLVDFHEHEDGTITVVLTEDGRKKALRYELDDITIKRPKSWSGKWHLVIFDVPEKKKPAREALRGKLKKLGLIELQKSVFVCPFECKDEIDFVAEVFGVGSNIRYIRADYITNEAELRKKFKLY
jgi:CRISPR-associated endonuclease Cas2